MTTVYIAELHGRKPPTWTAGVARLASRSIRAFPMADLDRPNAFFDARLLEVPAIERAIVAFGRAQGASQVTGGRLTIVNADRKFDWMMDWGWQEGLIQIWRIERDEGSAAPLSFANAVLVLTGVLGQPVPAYNRGRPTRIVFDVMDPLAELDDPLQPARYLGDNVPPAGYEGAPETVGGQTKADTWGRCLNVTLPMVNGSTDAFHAGADGVQEFERAYDRGAQLDRDTDLTGAAFDSTNPASTKFNSDRARGLAKFGSSLAERSATTWDVKGNRIGGVYVDTPAAMIKRMLKARKGWTDDRLDLDAFDALDAACPWEVGFFKAADEDVSFRQAIDPLISSVWGYRGLNRAGLFTLGKTTLPAGDGVLKIRRSDIVSVEQLQPVDRNNGLPPSETVVEFQRNWTVQRDGLAGSVLDNPDRKAWLGLEYRKVFEPASAGILAKYPGAKPLTVRTLLLQAAHAQALAGHVQETLEAEPDLLRIVVENSARMAALDLALCFELDYDQEDWSEKLWRTLRLVPNAPRAGLLTLEAWG